MVSDCGVGHPHGLLGIPDRTDRRTIFGECGMALASKKEWDTAVAAVKKLSLDFQAKKKEYRLAVAKQAVAVCSFEKAGTARAIAQAERRTSQCFAEDTGMNHGTLKQWIMVYRYWDKLETLQRKSSTWSELLSACNKAGKGSSPARARATYATIREKGMSAVHQDNKRQSEVNKAIRSPMAIVEMLEKITEAMEYAQPNPREAKLILGANKQLQFKMSALDMKQRLSLKAVK